MLVGLLHMCCWHPRWKPEEKPRAKCSLLHVCVSMHALSTKEFGIWSALNPIPIKVSGWQTVDMFGFLEIFLHLPSSIHQGVFECLQFFNCSFLHASKIATTGTRGMALSVVKGINCRSRGVDSSSCWSRQFSLPELDYFHPTFLFYVVCINNHCSFFSNCISHLGQTGLSFILLAVSNLLCYWSASRVASKVSSDLSVSEQGCGAKRWFKCSAKLQGKESHCIQNGTAQSRLCGG